MRQFRRLASQFASSVTTAGSEPSEQRAELSQELAALTWDDAQKEKVVVGTPEMVIEQLHKMKDTLNLSGVVAELNAGELISRDRIGISLRLLCEKVIPAFKLLPPPDISEWLVYLAHFAYEYRSACYQDDHNGRCFEHAFIHNLGQFASQPKSN